MRIVLDTNVVVSGLFFGGAPRVVLDAWADGKLQVVMTPSILDEYRQVCDRMSETYPATDYRKVLYPLVAQATMVGDRAGEGPVTADPDDDKFMWCAWHSGVPVVSGDRHMLDADGWRGVKVLTPRAFLTQFRVG